MMSPPVRRSWADEAARTVVWGAVPPLPSVPPPNPAQIINTLLERMVREDLRPVFEADDGPELLAQVAARAAAYVRKCIAIEEFGGAAGAGSDVDQEQRLSALLGPHEAEAFVDALNGGRLAVAVANRLTQRPHAVDRFRAEVEGAHGMLVVLGMCLNAQLAAAAGSLRPSAVGRAVIEHATRAAPRKAYGLLRGAEMTIEDEEVGEDDGLLPLVTPDDDVAAVMREQEAMDAEDEVRLQMLERCG